MQRSNNGATNETSVRIDAAGATIEGALGVPEGALGVVLFAHGAGSSRHSRRNNAVARFLRDAGLATLLIDLLTEQEDETHENRFDIDLLTARLIGAAQWLAKREETSSLPLGLFGASTGAAAALRCAATLGDRAGAVVSRGGRPDLAGEAIARVRAPTLLIVGGEDHACIPLNEQACEQLRCEKRLEVIPGASHLFEEPGKLDEVARLATDWFATHMG